MTITKHAIQRFQERISFESPDVIRFFILEDIRNSTPLYRVNGKEKRICNEIIYILDYTNEKNPIVLTLYLKEEE